MKIITGQITGAKLASKSISNDTLDFTNLTPEFRASLRALGKQGEFILRERKRLRSNWKFRILSFFGIANEQKIREKACYNSKNLTIK